MLKLGAERPNRTQEVAGSSPASSISEVPCIWAALAAWDLGGLLLVGRDLRHMATQSGCCGRRSPAARLAALGAAIGVVTANAGEEGGDEGEAELKAKEAERENCGNPATSPGSKFEWKGKGPVGSKEGSWYDPENDESLHPDLKSEDHGPHYDYEAPDGSEYRIYPDGRIEAK
jgi:hypothetical protein